MVDQGSTTRSLLFLDNSFLVEFHQTLLHMRENQQLTDILIKVGEESFPCHKMVLFASSYFFKQMLLNNLQESSFTQVELKGIDKPAIFATMLKYMYTGTIEIDVSNIQSIMEAQELLQLVGFKANSLQFMIKRIQPSNSILMHHLAKQYKHEEMAQRARAVMLREFEEVKETPEFLMMTESELTEYLSDDQLEVQSEDMVFKALMKWVHARSEERERSFTNIVQCIRFPLCSGNFLSAIRNEPLMINASCQQLLVEAALYQLDPEQRSDLAKPRDCQKEDLVVLGGLCTKNAINKRCWILQGGSLSAAWVRLPDFPIKLYGISACMTKEGIMVTGGRIHSNAKKYCFMLDIKSKKKQWKTSSPMAHARCSHKSLYYGNGVYVIGGWNKKCLNSVEMFNLLSHAWSEVTPMKKAVQQPMLSVCEDRMFVFGGHDGSSWLCCTQEYQAEQEKWILLAEMPEPCMAGDAASIDGHVLVVGGWSKSCMCYDPPTDMWTKLSKPFEEHWNAPALTRNRRILLGGGYQSTTVEQYDLQTDAWTCKMDMTMPKELWKHQMLSACLSLVSYQQAPAVNQESVQPTDSQYEWSRGTPVIIGGALGRELYIPNRTCWYLQEGGSGSASWEILNNLPHELLWISACATPRGIMVTGGRDTDYNSYRLCWLFLCREKQWTELPTMPSPRDSHASLCYDNAVYVAGGWNQVYLNSMEKFDLMKNAWSRMPPMEKAVEQHGFAECGGNLYVFGGFDGENWVTYTQEYNMVQQKWIFRAEMPVYGTACAVRVGGRIFIAGGGNRHFMYYEPFNNEWTMLHRSHEIHDGGPLLAWRETILVVGGRGSTKVEQYNPETDAWDKWHPSMPKMIRGHQMLSVDLF